MTHPGNNPKLTGDTAADQRILDLVASWNAPEYAADFAEMIASLQRLSTQDPTSSDIVLFKRSLAELRYAQGVFAPYRGVKKICIFGSARTPATAATYHCAQDFARLMTDSGFMTITGAGHGIMGAAQLGAGAEKSFGLNIMLPFEQHPNDVIRDDPKLVTFRYFFTRKLTFLREAAAIAVFPGGFGTLDEAMEVLTLMQTGKARLIPIVLIDEPRGTFWKNYIQYLTEHLMSESLISADDFNLFKLTTSITEARDEILRYYRNFHSYRFVNQYLVIRLQQALSETRLAAIRKEFIGILDPPTEIFQRDAFPQESGEPEIAHLPRLCLTFNRTHFGLLRLLIDRLNE